VLILNLLSTLNSFVKSSSIQKPPAIKNLHFLNSSLCQPKISGAKT